MKSLTFQSTPSSYQLILKNRKDRKDQNNYQKQKPLQ